MKILATKVQFLNLHIWQKKRVSISRQTKILTQMFIKIFYSLFINLSATPTIPSLPYKVCKGSINNFMFFKLISLAELSKLCSAIIL